MGKSYTVLVTIENKKFINDPEGKTILHDLILKSQYLEIKSVRTAKVLKLTVDAETANEATKIVKKMCDELRIFNPIVSDCKISISDQ